MNLDLRLAQEMEKILAKRLEQLVAEVVAGKAADYSDYRFRVGKLRGIQDALDALHEANKRVIGL